MARVQKIFEFSTGATYDGEKLSLFRKVIVKNPSGQIIGGYDLPDKNLKETILFIEETLGIKDTSRIRKMLDSINPS